MAKLRKKHKKSRSPAARTKRKAKRHARKAKRVMAAPMAPRRKRRRSSKSRMKIKRSRKRARARGGMIVLASKPTRRRRRRTLKRASAKKHRRARKTRVGDNPAASMSFLGGLTHLPANIKHSASSLKGVGAMALGAGGAVFAGTLLSRVTTPLAVQMVPSIATSSIGSRLLAAGNYYLTGYLLAKFVPGISHRTRMSIMAGAGVAAIAEAIKPDLVRSTLAKLPFVGAVFGEKLAGLSDDLGSYVAYALSGADGGKSSTHYDTPMVEQNGMADYVSLQGVDDYVNLQDYVEIR